MFRKIGIILFLQLTFINHPIATETRKAIFAGGCFWCIESLFKPMEGVVTTNSGYAQGKEKNPTYQQVSSGSTSHLEAVEVIYDPNKISYEKLLKEFWANIDPTDDGGQFADRGDHYRSAIIYFTEDQKLLAEKSKLELEKKKVYKKPIVTKIEKYKSFYKAEEYHQDYYKKQPIKYQIYKKGSGRSEWIDKYKDLL
jgi:peptide methionine sulfoxide reductase msrA/msrB